MPFSQYNSAHPPVSVFMQRSIGGASSEPRPSDPQLRRWIGELGNSLMWIGLLCEGGELRCLPNHDRVPSEIRGWAELPNLMDLISSLLDCGCEATDGNVILRTTEALYIALCLGRKPCLILGVEPSITLANLGFA